jgi:dihydroneopterin aldolase / 2-amino-4-hydroxy-6-hydroxymethyldihydropteridine diphosphokinase / dihydropteroate synthase
LRLYRAFIAFFKYISLVLILCLNLSLQIRTTNAPLTLLDLLKNIERTVGRVPSIRNGPRAVDLDILLYDDMVIDTRPEPLRGSFEGLEGHLVVPHPRMAEREFVLRPLHESGSRSPFSILLVP